VSYAALLSGMAVIHPAAASPSEVVLLNFAGSNGATPVASLTFNAYDSKSKILYGTTSAGGDLTKCGGKGCGTVFELIPPTAGNTNWTEQVLHEFQGGIEGATPTGSVIFDKSGALYGTTSAGGGGACYHYSYNKSSSGYYWTKGEKLGCGTAFSLMPPTPGNTVWTELLMNTFQGGSDGRKPPGNLIMDKTGALYGVTSQGGGGTCEDKSCAYFRQVAGSVPEVQYNPGLGTIFRLKKALDRDWKEEVIYTFYGSIDGEHPESSVQSSPDGGLYGTVAHGGPYGFGTVFKLMPSRSGAGRWHKTMFYDFGAASDDGIYPIGPLHLDNSTDGGLVGTTYGSFGPDARGAVFKLTPHAGGLARWHETIAHYFTGSGSFPLGGLNLDKATDTYYTTTSGGGEGACDLGGCGTVIALSPPSVGSGVDWRSTVLHKFGSGKDGKHPVAGMVRDAAGNFYGTTSEGGTQGMGTVFMITP
jgi:uncharacterized repeat protein (TIGR03803 family)